MDPLEEKIRELEDEAKDYNESAVEAKQLEDEYAEESKDFAIKEASLKLRLEMLGREIAAKKKLIAMPDARNEKAMHMQQLKEYLQKIELVGKIEQGGGGYLAISAISRAIKTLTYHPEQMAAKLATKKTELAEPKKRRDELKAQEEDESSELKELASAKMKKMQEEEKKRRIVEAKKASLQNKICFLEKEIADWDSRIEELKMLMEDERKFRGCGN